MPSGEQADGAPAATLLVLDYVGHRVEAPVGDLHLEAQGFDVRNVLAASRPREYRAAEYAAVLLDREPLLGMQVRAVLAYCIAGSIGQEMVCRITGSVPAVPMIVFDSEPVTARDINAEYRLARRKVWSFVSRERGGLAETVPFHDQAMRDDPRNVASRMFDELMALYPRALERGCLDPEAEPDDVELVANHLLDWLAHLLAGYNANWPSWHGPVHQIVSRDHSPIDPWPGAGSSSLTRIQTGRNELLRDPRTAAAVLALLRGELAAEEEQPVDRPGSVVR